MIIVMHYQKIKDITELIELADNELKEENPDKSSYESHFNQTDISYGCYHNKKLIGFVFGIQYDSLIYIMTIGVDNKYHGNGIGSKLIQTIIENNYKALPIWCYIHNDNIASKRLFNKFSFTQELKKNVPNELNKNFRTKYYPYKLEYKYNLHDYNFYKETCLLNNKINNLF